MRSLILAFIIVFSAASNADNFDAVVGACKIVMPGAVTDPNAAYYDLNPLASISVYAMQYKNNLDLNKIGENIENANISVLQTPSHGVLVGQGELIDYHPESNYAGNDGATLLVKIAGYKIKVVYSIYVGGVGNDELEYCPNRLLYQDLTKNG